MNHLNWLEYIELYHNGQIRVNVDKSTAMLIMDKKNGLVQLMPRGVQGAHIFWSTIAVLSILCSVLGFIFSFIFDIGPWYYWLLGIILSSLLTDSGVRQSAVEFIIEETLVNQEYYEKLILKEIILGQRILHIHYI